MNERIIYQCLDNAKHTFWLDRGRDGLTCPVCQFQVVPIGCYDEKDRVMNKYKMISKDGTENYVYSDKVYINENKYVFDTHDGSTIAEFSRELYHEPMLVVYGGFKIVRFKMRR